MPKIDLSAVPETHGSGYPAPFRDLVIGRHSRAMGDAGGFNPDDMWGAPWDPAWKRNDPVKQAATIAKNGTRLWIYCAPGGRTARPIHDRRRRPGRRDR